ncbi:hypothetical protein ACFWY5_28445 [Nonomuraea sp. NPDC059007]|uniref:hypothetical protein n=1 Tax=Nonomuraea sp. NPDC059007 TaxID=3346692 RepID=UPI0036BEFB3A
MGESAVPGVLLSASEENGNRARGLHGTVTTLRTATAGLTAGAFVGPCASRFLTTLEGLQTAFVTARSAHEEVADALRGTVAPIEEEQQARDRLERAERRLAEARRRLAALPEPVDPVALAQVRHEVDEAEQDVRRAQRRHEEAARDRARAVRALAVTCQGAAVVGGTPAPPGEVLLGPRLHDVLKSKDMRTRKLTADGLGLTPQELRRLKRNGLAPGSPLASLLYGKYGKDEALLADRTRVKGALGELDAEYALGRRAFEVFGGLGRIGSRYGLAGGAHAEAYALSADARLRRKLGPADLSGNLSVRAAGGEVSANGEFSVDRDGFRAGLEGGAFTGFKGGADIAVDVGGVKPSAGVEGQLGFGASLKGGASFQDGKFKVQGAAGLAFGPGAKLKGGLEIDVAKIAEAPLNAAKSIRDAPGDLVKMTKVLG